MNKSSLTLVICAILGANFSMAQDNIFAPKESAVSQDEIKSIVQRNINEKQFQMENEFVLKIEELQEEQERKYQMIFEKLKEMEEKKAAEKISNAQRFTNKQNQSVGQSDGGVSYDESTVDTELAHLLNDIEDDTFILTDDIILLNKEFGENSLSFVAIVDNHKLYKNQDGEYIVKGLDFDYAKFKKENEKKQSQNENIEPPRAK